jgi:hypothetical protein
VILFPGAGDSSVDVMEKHNVDAEKSPVGSEFAQRLSTTSRDDAILHEVSKEEEKKIIHRIDRRLVLMVGILYW